MPHQDVCDDRTNLQVLKALFAQLLPASFDLPKPHGNAALSPQAVAAWAIVTWGWLQGTLDERVEIAQAAITRVLPIRLSATRQGLLKALARYGEALIRQVVTHLAEQLPSIKGSWSCDGKINFAVDGTKFAAPRTAKNQACFGALKRRKYKSKSHASKAASAQLLATVVWHLGTGLPYCWHIAGSKGSENRALQSMLDELPTNARIIADAAYIGYPLWSAMIGSGHSFVVRVGANITLLKNLGSLKFHAGFVYFWPDKIMRKQLPPLVLRLIQLHTGRGTIYLVTNELEMSDATASELYRSRWGIEVFFRTVKQSCQRAKLRCRTPENVHTEIHWTLIGVWAALHFAQQNCEPKKQLSPVKIVRAFATTALAIAWRSTIVEPLVEQLAQAVNRDESNRKTSKRNRHYPRKQQPHTCGPPKLLRPSKEQRHYAKQLGIT